MFGDNERVVYSNVSAPGFSFLEVTGIQANSDTMTAVQPTGNSLSQCVCTLGFATTVNTDTYVAESYPAWVRYDSADGTPVVGGEVGCKSGSLKASTDEIGWLVMAVRETEELCLVRPFSDINSEWILKSHLSNIPNSGVALSGTSGYIIETTNNTPSAAWISNDSGENWSAITGPSLSEVWTHPTGLDFDGTTLRVASSFTRNTHGTLFSSNDNGSTWSFGTVPHGTGAANRFTSIVSAGTDLYLTGYDYPNAILYKSSDEGTNWGAYATTTPNSTLMYLAASGTDVYALEYFGGLTGVKTQLALSKFSGTAWISTNNLSVFGGWDSWIYGTPSLVASPDGTVWVSSPVSPGLILQTTDDGSSWVEEYIPNTIGHMNTMAIINNNVFGATEAAEICWRNKRGQWAIEPDGYHYGNMANFAGNAAFAIGRWPCISYNHTTAGGIGIFRRNRKV